MIERDWVVVCDILTGEVLIETRSVANASEQLNPGTVYGKHSNRHVAEIDAKNIARKFRESGYQPLERMSDVDISEKDGRVDLDRREHPDLLPRASEGRGHQAGDQCAQGDQNLEA